MSAYNFGGSGRNLTKLYHGTWLEAEVIKWTLILQRVPVQHLGGQKCPKFGAIFDNFDREYLRNTSTCRQSEQHLINYISSPIRQKQFGELWSTNEKVIDAHVDPPNWTFFRRLYFGPQGCWPLKYLHTLQPAKMYFTSDVGRRAASCWALPHNYS